MKKFLFALAAVVGMVAAVSYADQIPNGLDANGMSHADLNVSRQVFSGGGTFYRVDLPTNTAYGDFVQIFDTVCASNVLATLQSNTTDWMVTTPIVLPASSTGTPVMWRDFQPYGIYVKNGLFVYNSNSSNYIGVGYKR